MQIYEYFRTQTTLCGKAKTTELQDIRRAALGAAAFGVGIEVSSALAVGQRHPSSAEVHIHRLAAVVAVQHCVAVYPNPVLAGEVVTAVVAMFLC